VDVALWDIGGKDAERSISELPGCWRSSVPASASISVADDHPDGLGTPEAFASFAEECRDRGYPAFELHASGDPDHDVELCRVVAEASGDEMDLVVDPASEYETDADAMQVGRVLDEHEFFWSEHPMSDTGKSIHLSKKPVRELETHIRGHEHVRTVPFGRADHVTADALDLLRADAHIDGGIIGVTKIANLAEAHGLDVERHLGGPAHRHCMSVIRNTNYFEKGLLHPHVEWMSAGASEPGSESVDHDGTVTGPDEPGLGVDVDWDLVDCTLGWVESYPLLSLEDPLAEGDWAGWSRLRARLPDRVRLVGDDLLVTDRKRLRRAIEEDAAEAVLVKPDQAGTLSDVFDVLELAKRERVDPIVSARSGETCDATIADLAVAKDVDRIKIGSLARSERLAKYNRLLEIADEHDGSFGPRGVSS